MSELLQVNVPQSLLDAVENDEKKQGGFHSYRAKLEWIKERAIHYAEKTGLNASDILASWESGRNYWYMNYYQDSKQPKIEGDHVRVFDTLADCQKSIVRSEFRCPRCNGVSKNPYECESGLEMSKGEICDWKVYGLFGDLGKGVHVFVKEKMIGQTIFMPIAWESVDGIHDY